MERQNWVLIQSTLVILAVAYLLFVTIILSSDASTLSLNIALDLILVSIVLLSLMRGLGHLTGKMSQNILLALVLTFLALYLLFKTEILVVSQFNISSLDYMIMGLLVAIGLYISYRGPTTFITWANTNLWRDLFFMAVGVWFVFAVTTYLSVVNNTAFETTTFLGVPFSATTVSYGPDIIEATVKFAAGFIEANFFFCLIVGIISAAKISRLIPSSTWWQRLIPVLIVSLLFGVLVAVLHTGLHDVSQRATLSYISLFFITGAICTLYWETSFSFIMAQALLDFIKGLFNTGNPSMVALGWSVFAIISVVGVVAFLLWRGIKIR